MEERYDGTAGFGYEKVNPEEVQEENQDELVTDEEIEEEPLDEGDEEGFEDEEGSEEKPSPKGRDNAQSRINRLTKEKYKFLNRAEKAQADAEYWRKKYELSSELNLRQSDLNANARLEKARNDLINATELGDAKAQADANIAISAAMADLQEINREKIKSEYEQKAKQYQQPEPQEQIDAELRNDWVQENNDWINPESQKFNQELANYIYEIDFQKGQELRAAGKAHLIGTAEYYDFLDAHKEHFLKSKTQSPRANQRRELNMKQARGGAAPVRGASQAQYRNGSSYQLTPTEKVMVDSISHLGVSEDVYRKAKMKYLKEEAAAKGGL